MSSSSEDVGERLGGSLAESSEKSSIEAGSEGDVMISGEVCSTWAVVEVTLLVPESILLDVTKERSVGRFGVDFDWTPTGIGDGFSGGGCPLPLL